MISRVIRGFVDGSLSTLGIVIGASAGSSLIIIAAAVGGTVANGISNLLSGVASAGSQEYEDLRQIERAMVSKDMRGSARYRNVGRQTALAGGADALATVAGGSIPIIPYLFAPPLTAVWFSAGLVITSVFVVGLYLGKVSRQNILFSGAKMAVFAVVIAGVVYLIQGFIGA